MIRAIRSAHLWRALRYTLLFLFLVMTETVLLPRVVPDPVVPDLILCAVIAVGMAEDEKTAGICGVCAACVTRAGYTLLLIQFDQADCPLDLAFAEILAPEFLWTMLASPLLYLIVALPLAKRNRRELKN